MKSTYLLVNKPLASGGPQRVAVAKHDLVCGGAQKHEKWPKKQRLAEFASMRVVGSRTPRARLIYTSSVSSTEDVNAQIRITRNSSKSLSSKI